MLKPEEYGGIVDVSTAIHEYYGLDGSGKADSIVSKWLDENRFRCVVVLLIDAMGTSILRRHAEKDSFFLEYTAENVTTVFPPTTTAATTSLLTGKYPKETAWLGWHQFFKEKQDQIILFLNRGKYDSRMFPGYSYEALPVEMIMDRLVKKGIRAESVWPAWGNSHPSRDFKELLDNTAALAKEADCRFIYAYWDDLDTYMHINGASDENLPRIISYLDQEVQAFAQRLPSDTGLLILADHSMVDVEHCDIAENAEISACLRSAPAIEQRAAALYIRKNSFEMFEKAFRETLGDSFTLLSHREAVESNLFGRGTPHPRFEEFIGDYLAVAETPVQLDYPKVSEIKGNHAGGLRDEAVIPIILYPRL